MAVSEPSMSTPVAPYRPPAQPTFGKKLWKSMRTFPMVYVGGSIVLFLIVVAVFAPFIATHDPVLQSDNGLTNMGTPGVPNHEFIWGADDLGRDIFSRVVYGSRVSLVVGVMATLISLVIGVVLGLLAGYFGKWVDYVLMRLTDVILAFPFLLFTMALVAVLKPDLKNVLIAIGVTGWGTIARVVRGSVLSLKEFDYVQAERALGASGMRIMFRVILPNIIGPVIVLTTLNIGFAVLTEAGLSFLGIGVQQPTPSWGSMIDTGMSNYQIAPWTLYYPGLALLLSVLGFNMLGDGLRDMLDPHNTERR